MYLTKLELLIDGLAEIDVEDWKKHTDYRGYQENDQVIQWFWQCIKEWDSEQKARLLQFTTGTSRIPVNDLKTCRVLMVLGGSRSRRLADQPATKCTC